MAHQSPDIYGDFSEFYDLYVGDWMEDFPFYLAYARLARTPVLEIGAGSGRLTIALARAGVNLVGIDISASMLSKLESRLAHKTADVRQRVRVLAVDVCELSLGTTHDLIIFPFYAFNYLLDDESQHRALESLAAHLRPGGRLVVDVFVPWGLIERCPSEPVLKVDTRDPRSGQTIRGWNAYTIDTVRQVETRRHIFEITSAEGSTTRKEFTTTRRYSFPAELDTLFTSAGYSIENVFTGYRRERPQPQSGQLVYVLRHR